MAVKPVVVLFNLLALAVPSYGSPYDEQQIIPSTEPADFPATPVDSELKLNALSAGLSEKNVTFSEVPGIEREEWENTFFEFLGDSPPAVLVDNDIWARFPTCPENYSVEPYECDALFIDKLRRRSRPSDKWFDDMIKAVYHHVNSEENKERYPDPERTVELIVKSKSTEAVDFNVTRPLEPSIDGYSWGLYRYPRTCLMQTRVAGGDQMYFGYNYDGWYPANRTNHLKHDGYHDKMWPWCWEPKESNCQAEQGVSFCRRCPPYQRKVVTTITYKNAVGYWKTAQEQRVECEDMYAKSGKHSTPTLKIPTLTECREAAAQFGISEWVMDTNYFEENADDINSDFRLDGWKPDDIRKRHKEAPTYSTFYYYTRADDGLLLLKEDGIEDDDRRGICIFAALDKSSKNPKSHAVYWTTKHKNDEAIRKDMEKRGAFPVTAFEVCMKRN